MFLSSAHTERLQQTEGLLKAKEMESMLSLQQIKEKEEIREEDLKTEIIKLTEKCKHFTEKISSLGKEITLKQEEIDNEKSIFSTETRKFEEKITIIEISQQDLGLKFRESDQLSKSLRAVLREKDDQIMEIENLILQKQQEQLLMSAEFQRKFHQVRERGYNCFSLLVYYLFYNSLLFDSFLFYSYFLFV